MPLYTARIEGPRVHLIPLTVPTGELKSQPLKVLVIKGDDRQSNLFNQKVEEKLDLLGHDWDDTSIRAISLYSQLLAGNYSRVVINMNTLSDSERKELFDRLLSLKSRFPGKLPPVIAYTEGKTYDDLERAAVKEGPVDLILAPYGGPYSTSGYPTHNDLQAALELNS